MTAEAFSLEPPSPMTQTLAGAPGRRVGRGSSGTKTPQGQTRTGQRMPARWADSPSWAVGTLMVQRPISGRTVVQRRSKRWARATVSAE